MISPRWRKMLRDLQSNRTRTALVTLSIAVGIFAVGVILTTRMVLLRELNASYAASNPADALFFTESFDDQLLQVVRGMPGVRDAEGRRGSNPRIQIAPDEWRNVDLVAIPDFARSRINAITPERGSWPPPPRTLLVERASLDFLQAAVGDKLLLEMPDGLRRTLRVSGLAHDIDRPNADIEGRAFVYVSVDTLEWLGQPRTYNELRLDIDGAALDKQYIADVAQHVRQKIEKSGRRVYWMNIPEPGKHPADDIIQTLLLLLGAFGAMSLFLSGFLVVNTISALLSQHIRQIGVMKTIGASRSQIIALYLGMTLTFGLLALAVAAPLGAIGAYVFTRYLAGLINFDVTHFTVPLPILAIEAAIGLLTPTLAALVPVVTGSRISVREAISSYGLGKGAFGAGLLDRLLVNSDRLPPLRALPRPILLSLRNTIRRKGRLALTLTTLTLGGAIFISVFSVRDSLNRTLDDMYRYLQFDVWVGFDRFYRIDYIQREALKVPGVVAVESWGGANARRVRADGAESKNIRITAPPAATRMLQPTILQGRWLLPDDENALVINSEVLEIEPDIRLGDAIVLNIDERKTTWRVVGVVRGLLIGPVAYAHYPYFARVTENVGRAGWVQAIIERHDPDSQARMVRALSDRFEQIGVRVSETGSSTSDRASTEAQFDILFTLLMIMAVLLGVVGGLGLMGTMSINVIERTREIGVLRAIGASTHSVIRIVLVEGVIIGLISWAAGALLSFPLSKLLSNIVGVQFLDTPLSYTFSTFGLALWLATVVVLAALSSFLPAWNASRLTVRDVLAYE